MAAAALKLQTNLPEVLALKFAGPGIPVSSQFAGDQVMYTLTDDRKLYVAPIVAAKIDALELGVGELFSICKREVTRGNRRTVEYQVALVPCDGTTDSSPEKPAASSAVVPTAKRTEQSQNSPAVVLGAGASVVQSEGLAACFRAAVDVALDAVAYAKQRGLLLTPQFEDVRAMAATLHIDRQKRGAA